MGLFQSLETKQEASSNDWRMKMHAAITELEIALNVRVNNEPINRAEGKIEQADFEAKAAAEIRQAIAILEAARNGPIYPEPKG